MNQSPKTNLSTRREFAKIMGYAMIAGAGIAATRPQLSVAGHRKTVAPIAVAKNDEIPISGYRLFRYPTKDDPCILVRLAADHFVAYSQSCTHLTCPVHYQAEKSQFYCPCHEGYFSAIDGAVMAGPPRRPLPRYAVEVRDGQIWVGQENPGRHDEHE